MQAHRVNAQPPAENPADPQSPQLLGASVVSGCPCCETAARPGDLLVVPTAGPYTGRALCEGCSERRWLSVGGTHAPRVTVDLGGRWYSELWPEVDQAREAWGVLDATDPGALVARLEGSDNCDGDQAEWLRDEAERTLDHFALLLVTALGQRAA